jgi:hypothetical protein
VAGRSAASGARASDGTAAAAREVAVRFREHLAALSGFQFGFIGVPRHFSVTAQRFSGLIEVP